MVCALADSTVDGPGNPRCAHGDARRCRPSHKEPPGVVGLSNKESRQAVVSVRRFCGGRPRGKWRNLLFESRASHRRFGEDESQLAGVPARMKGTGFPFVSRAPKPRYGHPRRGVLLGGHPKRARQLASVPRVADCAEQLARALRAIIDPPLPMLEVRGIAPSASGEGVVVVRVGPSPSAPHGFGVPPATYVRHGSESKPLSMRELQSMFFERRTRLERVASRRQELASFAQQLWDIRIRGHLRTVESKPFAPDKPAIQFRCSLVPTDDLALDNFPDRFLGTQSKKSPKPQISDPVREVVGLPEWTNEWRRRYRAVEHVGDSSSRLYWHASLEADGVVNLITIIAAENEPFPITPAWYAKVILQGMILAEWFRRWASRPDVEYALDGEFWNKGAVIRTDYSWSESSPVSWFRESIGPYSVGSRATYKSAFDLIERELWDAFGLPCQTRLAFDLVKVFQSVGL
jgi:hypothetical protein